MTRTHIAPANVCDKAAANAPGLDITTLTDYEVLVLSEATLFAATRRRKGAIRGENPYVRREFDTYAAAANYAAAMRTAAGDRVPRTMMYAVTADGRSAHLGNM